VCIKACGQCTTLFKSSCLLQWKIWPSHNTKIYYGMSPFMGMDIDPRFRGLNLGIMFIYIKNHLPHWMWRLRMSFFHVKKDLSFGILLFEDWNDQVWKDIVWNYAPCHLPHVDGQMDPSLVIVLKGLQCMLCGKSRGAITTCWFVTIISEVGILVVWHCHFWNFPLDIGCVHYAPNKHVLLFHVRLLYWDICMFLIGALGDF
jgi:hypothetical protein